jgi:SAM-dependent methyltransferase
MGVGFGGNAAFNRASPSSHRRCVARILASFLPAGRPPRLLDVGGTATGFRGQADLPTGSHMVIVNPQQGVGASYDYARDMPPHEADFDLIMMFGVMMYMTPAELLAEFRLLKQRLRGDGTLLVAEPDTERAVGWIDMQLKRVYAPAKNLFTPTHFTFHKSGDVKALMREAGFFQVAERDDLTPNLALPRYYVLAARV